MTITLELDEEKMARLLKAHILDEAEGDLQSAKNALDDGEYIGKLMDKGYLLKTDECDSEENLLNIRVIEAVYSEICNMLAEAKVIKADDYTSTTIKDLIAEIETRETWLVEELASRQLDVASTLEAIASHIITTDTDYFLTF
jgi:hypothetical protein